jgi:hypothetical protein
MGIRRSYGKNKKSNRPTDATTVEREDILRRAANVRSRFDGTHRRAQAGADRTEVGASSSQDGRSARRPPGAASGK